MTDTVNLYEAKTHLSELVERAAAGEEIVIAKAGQPRAKLVPIQPAPAKRRKGGFLRGKIWISPHFDDPLPPDLLDAFEGRRSHKRK